jgi:hypothetical protein
MSLPYNRYGPKLWAGSPYARPREFGLVQDCNEEQSVGPGLRDQALAGGGELERDSTDCWCTGNRKPADV